MKAVNLLAFTLAFSILLLPAASAQTVNSTVQSWNALTNQMLAQQQQISQACVTQAQAAQQAAIQAQNAAAGAQLTCGTNADGYKWYATAALICCSLIGALAAYYGTKEALKREREAKP